MFDWRYTYEDDYGWETVDNFNSCPLEEALKAIKGHEDDASIETAIYGTIVFKDGEWLMTPEEAKAIAAEEEAAEEGKKAEKEAAAAAEAATFGDELDKANIAFIMSIANKYPARDSGAARTAAEIGKKEEWKNKNMSFKLTESDVIHLLSGREYHIDMWRGERKVTRTATVR